MGGVENGEYKVDGEERAGKKGCICVWWRGEVKAKGGVDVAVLSQNLMVSLLSSSASLSSSSSP